MRLRRLIAAGLVVPACAAVVGTVLAAPAADGKHFPDFSLMNERVAVKKLPFGIRLLLGGLPGRKPSDPRQRGHGPVWFGEVQRPNATILAAGRGQWVCDWEESKDEAGGGGGGGICTTPAGARELSLLDVTSCGNGRPRHFRISGLVPDGVTALELEKNDGTIGRTVPVVDNTIAFSVGLEDFSLHGVGDAAAEGLERTLPLARAGELGDKRPGCSFYTFAEAKAPK